MTELEQLLAWLIRVNLPYSTWRDGDKAIICLEYENGQAGRSETDYTKHAGDPELIAGYQGFFHAFVFDEHEELIESGSWE